MFAVSMRVRHTVRHRVLGLCKDTGSSRATSVLAQKI